MIEIKDNLEKFDPDNIFIVEFRDIFYLNA